jgi:cytochrome c oxidase subunit II
MRRSPLLRILAALSIATVGVLYVWLVWDSIFGNDGKPLTTLSPQGSNAQTIQNLVVPVFVVAGLVGVAVFGATLYILWRFRVRDEVAEADEFPEQVHGKTVLEIGWTILPAVILAGIAVATVITIIDLEDRDDTLQIRVYGQQWWWGYQYDGNGDGDFDDVGEDFVTATELVIPAGQEVELIQTSNDVIHSFWIPGLNGKKDTVPGMTTYNALQADEPGVYRGQCTEYCGLSHANMRMLVRAVDRATFDEWFENQRRSAEDPAPGSLAEEGKAQFANLCAQCHVVRGQFENAIENQPPLVAGVAPDLTHFATRGTYAGSIYNLYTPQAPDEPVPTPGDPFDVALAGDPGGAFTGGDAAPFFINRPTLEAWLRNPPAMKPAYAQGQRGMPNLGLTEEQIDQLVAYLETLK